jgi:hypothetical protein
MNTPRVVLMSLWRNDYKRRIGERASRLLDKTYPNIRFVWVVGDSEDETETYLREVARFRPDRDITIIRHDTHIEGNDPSTRVKRISQTYNAGFDDVRDDDDYWCLHESDLTSPPDLIERFLGSGLCPVAGWVTLDGMFYDTWAYRKDGRHFTNGEPRPSEPFTVDSFGSCALWHAGDLRAGVRTDSFDFVELCEKLRKRGWQLWVDPRIEIVQPHDLWVPYAHA